MNSLNYLQQKIQNAKDLDFGTVFNQAIELYKKVWVQGLLLQVFAILIMMPFILMFYVPFINEIMEQSRTGNVDPEALNSMMFGDSPMYILVFYLVVFALSAISALLYAGFYRVEDPWIVVKKLKLVTSFIFSKANILVKGFY